MSNGNDDSAKRWDDSPLKRWAGVPLIQMILSGTLGAAGATGYQVSQLSTMINDRVYAVVNSDCQKYYAEAVKTVLNQELEKSKQETNEKLERLDQRIPPIPLRKRILSIEDYLKEQGKGYKVPTYDWN